MRYAPLVMLAACTTRAAAPPPPQNTVAVPRIPADLGAIVLVTAPVRADTTPTYVPITTAFPIVDPMQRIAPHRRVHVVDEHGYAGDFVSGPHATIKHGCDDHKLAITPLVGTARMKPGVAWAVFDSSVHPTAVPIATQSAPALARYTFPGLTIEVKRNPTKLDRGTVQFIVDNDPGLVYGFERALMDGADPSLATVDLSAEGPGIPVPRAAWSIDGSGDPPLLVTIERPGWEGTQFEVWLVDGKSVKPLESMRVYLYQCAF